MSETSAAPFHVGLTPGRIIDVALELTRESHLFGWSIRDLGRRLGVAPSVIYHHIGGKDLIARHVAERVLAELAVPDAELDWRDWFRTLLDAIYPIITAYPGVAKWLLLHAPTFPSVLPIIDAGVATLQRGGFGERAGFAYAALLNNAMLTISIGDERLLHDDDGPRDHATMMDEFRRAATDSPGVALLAETFIAPFGRGGDIAARQRKDYYHYIVQTTVAGLAATPARGRPVPGLPATAARGLAESFLRQQTRYSPDPVHAARAVRGAIAGKPEALVVDAGCAVGAFVSRLVSENPHARVVGIDLDPVLLAIGRTAFPELHLHRRNLLDHRWARGIVEPGTVAVLTALATVHYFSREQLAAFLRTVRGILRPDGVIVISERFAREEPAADPRPDAVRSEPELNWGQWWDQAADVSALARVFVERRSMLADGGITSTDEPVGLHDLLGLLQSGGFTVTLQQLGGGDVLIVACRGA